MAHQAMISGMRSSEQQDSAVDQSNKKAGRKTCFFALFYLLTHGIESAIMTVSGAEKTAKYREIILKVHL